LALLGLAACGHARGLAQDPVDAQFIIPRDGARSATVHLTSHDALAARAGKCSLVQARARYDARRSEVSTDFTMDTDGHGNVSVALGPKGMNGGSARLDACLTTEIPLRLDTTTGTGDLELDLSGIQLRGLDLASGTGDIAVDAGDGSIAQTAMTVNVGTGDVQLDGKRSSWTGKNSLSVDAGTGDVTLYLPRNIGIRLEVDNGTGDVRVVGLQQDDDGWSNELAATATDSLDIQIDVGTGDVAVIVG
jgi:hypothetical protein